MAGGATKDAQGEARARAELIDGLNEDLAGEFQAVIMYRLFASLCTGPYRGEIRDFFEKEIPDELGHAQFLADKITAMGGMPTSVPAPVPVSRDNREMFELALRAEKETIERYRARMDQAQALGEIGLAARLEDLIVDETQHRDEIEMILRDWKG